MSRLKEGQRLPRVTLPEAGTANGRSLRHGRSRRVVVALHGDDCGDCARYADSLADTADAFREWGGEVILVLPGPGEGAGPRLSGSDFLILRDEEGVFADGRARVAVADEWAEVYFTSELDPSHREPSPEELAEWLRFVAIQCPECESPEGPWRTL